MRFFLGLMELRSDWSLANYLPSSVPNDVDISWITRVPPGDLLLRHTWGGGLLMLFTHVATNVGPPDRHPVVLMKYTARREPDVEASQLPLENADMEVMMAWLRNAPRNSYAQIQNLSCDCKWKHDKVLAYYAVCLDQDIFHDLPLALQANPHIAAAHERIASTGHMHATDVRALRGKKD